MSATAEEQREPILDNVCNNPGTRRPIAVNARGTLRKPGQRSSVCRAQKPAKATAAGTALLSDNQTIAKRCTSIGH